MKTLLNTVYNYIDNNPENDMTLHMMYLLLEAEIPLLEDIKEFEWQLYLNYNKHLDTTTKNNLIDINSLVERIQVNLSDNRNTVPNDKLLDTHIESFIKDEQKQYYAGH